MSVNVTLTPSQTATASVDTSNVHFASSSYSDLTDKPKIAGVELSGNKTPAQLGVAAASHTHTTADITDYPEQVITEISAGTGIVTSTSAGQAEIGLSSETQASLALADTALQEPSTGLAVGKYFRIASLDESGHAVLEACDAPTGGVTDVQVAGESVVTSGVASIPTGNGSQYGVFKIGQGLKVASNLLFTDNASQAVITARSSYYKTIGPAVLDYAVKAAMTDGIGTAWTDSEKTGAWSRLTSIKTAMDSVAVAGAQYFLGTQTAVSITMPTDALVGQEILVVFTSGSTACTLTCDLTGFSFVPSANKTSWIKFTLHHKADTSVSGDEDEWIVETKEG